MTELESQIKNGTLKINLRTKPSLTLGGKPYPKTRDTNNCHIESILKDGIPVQWNIYFGAYYAYYLASIIGVDKISRELEKEGLRGKVGGKDRPPCGTIPERICLNAGYNSDGSDATYCENAREIIAEALSITLSPIEYIK